MIEERNHCLGDVTQLHYKRLLMDAQNFPSRVKKPSSDRYWRRNGKDIGIGIPTHIHLFRPCKRQRVGCIGHTFYLDIIWVDIKDNAHERCIIIFHNDIHPLWKGKWQVGWNLGLVASFYYYWILLNLQLCCCLIAYTQWRSRQGSDWCNCIFMGDFHFRAFLWS